MEHDTPQLIKEILRSGKAKARFDGGPLPLEFSAGNINGGEQRRRTKHAFYLINFATLIQFEFKVIQGQTNSPGQVT